MTAHPLAPTLRRTVHFAWVVVVNVAIMVVAWLPFVLHSLVQRNAAAFRFWARVWTRPMLWASGFRVRSTQAAPVEGPVVYVANHQNALDIPVLLAALPTPFVFVARAELSRVPVLATYLARMACVFLDRSSSRQASEALDATVERLRSGDSVLFFPEGTRSHERPLSRFKTGAFRAALEAGVPVVPVAISGITSVVDERRRISQPGPVRVRIGAPIVESDVAKWAERAREAVAEALGPIAPEPPAPSGYLGAAAPASIE